MSTVPPLPGLEKFERIWLADFEYSRPVGCLPRPVCATFQELRKGQVFQRWLWGEAQPLCPIGLGNKDLYVSYFLPAELICHDVLHWPFPVHALDLAVEYRLLRNGRYSPMGLGLIAALLTFGIDGAPYAGKSDMQMLAARGGPFTLDQQQALLAYNRQDVRALENLLPAMLPVLDIPRAVYRGRFMVGVSRMETWGIPLDTDTLSRLAQGWRTVKTAMIEEVNQTCPVWEDDSFREKRWETWTVTRGIRWPKLESGRLKLDGDTFNRMAEVYPAVRPVQNLRRLLDQLPDFDLPVGPDRRHRYEQWAFGTITGRATPKAAECLLLWPKWCRGLVRPGPDRALISLDYSQQEYLISGVLSGDTGIIEDYRTGDVYIALGKTLGLIPPEGTKVSHKKERSLCKVIVLAVTYGMGQDSLARKIRRPVTVAADLLRRHRQRYARFWRWSDATVKWARCHRWLRTRFGWSAFFPPGTKETTLRNWRTQATGGEVLRAAVCALDAAGFQLCATLHDSVLLECPAEGVNQVAKKARAVMVRASQTVLGEPLRVDATVIGSGERWLEDEQARATWDYILNLLNQVEEKEKRSLLNPQIEGFEIPEGCIVDDTGGGITDDTGGVLPTIPPYISPYIVSSEKSPFT